MSDKQNREIRAVMEKTNWIIIVAACMLIILGFLLMTGEGSSTTAFNPDIFSVRRIVIAPAVCLVGYLLVIVGIAWRR